MNNAELADLLYKNLEENKDVYYGDAEKALEDIFYERGEEAAFRIEKQGNVFVVTGYSEDVESIDLRVILKNDRETVDKVEAF